MATATTLPESTNPDLKLQEPKVAAKTVAKNGRWSAYRHLLAARVKELFREPTVLFWLVGFPVLTTFALGTAFRNRPPDVSHVAVVLRSQAELPPSFLQTSKGSRQIDVEAMPEPEAQRGFQLGRYELIVRQQGPHDFQIQYDPTRPESVLANLVVEDALQSAAGRKDAVRITALSATQPGSRYIDFLIPGLIGMNMMSSGLWGMGFALVDMRQRKLLKRYIGTPMRQGDFFLALITSRLLLMATEMALVLALGIIIFKVPVAGSFLSIAAISILGFGTFTSLGFLAATTAQKIETVNGIITLTQLPMWMFSGVFFSYHKFPLIFQKFIKLLPLTALNDALRSTILEGSPLVTCWGQILILCLWAALAFAGAFRRFKWV